MLLIMNPTSLVVYAGAALALWLKFLFAITLQARERFKTKHFRYAEDATCWRGQVADDSESCTRAQRLLANDSEGQGYFLILALLYALMNVWPLGALIYFPAYVALRWLHAYYLLRPRQPHRTRVFGAGLAVQLVIAGHVIVASVHLALGE